MAECSKVVVGLLADMKTTVENNHIQISKVVEGCKYCRQDVQELRKAIVGDNGEGLKTKVSVCQTQIEQLQTDSDKASAWSRKTIGAVITCLLGLLTIVALAFKAKYGG